MKIQRHLPPTAAPLSILDIVYAVTATLRPRRSRSLVVSELQAYFGVKHVFLVSSGKAALTLILQALRAGTRRSEVIIPAYTCFSVASAVRRAGLKLVLCDIDPGTMDLNPVQLKALLGNHTLAVVAPHFLGQPADIAQIKRMAGEVGAFVIEDTAQAMGGRDNGRWLGTQGDVGFFSLGRGKNVSAGSGGIIVTDSETVANALSGLVTGLQSEPLIKQMTDALVVVATKMLLHPMLYWIPAGLPFLGLGETRYDETFPICRMGALRIGLLFSWKSRLESANRSRSQNSRLFLERLKSSLHMQVASQSVESPMLRLPLLMPTAQAKAAMCRIGHEKGLGVSGLYPATIARIPELKDLLQSTEFPGADAVASRLVTLPVHRYVTREDIDEICRTIQMISAGKY